MLKSIKYYVLILIFFASPKAYGLAEFQQNIQAKYPSVVLITSTDPAHTKGKIDPETGIITNPYATFRILTTGRESDYDFILSATTNTLSGDVNAYHFDGNNMYMLLSNLSTPPTLNAINDIKSNNPNSKNNQNVIAYQILNEPSRGISSFRMANEKRYNGLHYKFNMSSFRSQIRQTLGSNPLANTYSIDADQSGTYQSTITLTVIANF